MILAEKQGTSLLGDWEVYGVLVRSHACAPRNRLNARREQAKRRVREHMLCTREAYHISLRRRCHGSSSGLSALALEYCALQHLITVTRHPGMSKWQDTHRHTLHVTRCAPCNRRWWRCFCSGCWDSLRRVANVACFHWWYALPLPTQCARPGRDFNLPEP